MNKGVDKRGGLGCSFLLQSPCMDLRRSEQGRDEPPLYVEGHGHS